MGDVNVLILKSEVIRAKDVDLAIKNIQGQIPLYFTDMDLRRERLNEKQHRAEV